MTLFQSRHPLCINDLRKELRKRQDEIDEKKKSCKIVIIDDDIDDPDYLLKGSIEYLRIALMMDVRTLTDIHSPAEVSQFDIIICDVDGVGLSMGLPNGIDLIKRLKDLYKDKLYAVMSQELFQMRKLNIEKDISRWDKGEMAEAFRKSSNGTLEEKVLKLVDKFADPAARWEVIRTGLLKNSMPIHDVAKLESAYVQSILKKNRVYYEKAVGQLDAPMYDSDEKIINYIKTAASIIGVIISII